MHRSCVGAFRWNEITHQTARNGRFDGTGIDFWKHASFTNGVGRTEVKELPYVVLLPESGSGQDIPEVRGGILWKKRILLTARNTSSLVIDSLCD